MRDNLDLLVKRLGRLVDVLESKEFGSTTSKESVTVNKTVRVDEPDESNTSGYFSTGVDRLAVENTDEWERIDFGFVAAVVNLRTTDDLEVSLENPNKSGTPFTVRANESPFTIGSGDAGIDTAFMWVRQADTAQADPGLELLAYK